MLKEMVCAQCGESVERIHLTEKAVSINDWVCDGCTIDRLTAELASRTLKWQTGKPPKDGLYLTRIPNSKKFSDIGLPWSEAISIRVNLQEHPFSGVYFWINRQWAGPIPEPEEE